MTYGERIVENSAYFSGYNREYIQGCKIVKSMGKMIQQEFAYSIACRIESYWKQNDRMDKVREIFDVSDDFEVSVVDFLNYSELKLKNFEFKKVKLSRENIFSMVRGTIMKKILSDIDNSESITSNLQYRKFNNVISTKFPPCVKKYIDEIKSGKNIPHTARFLLATFHINKGFSLDYIKDIYSNAPNFIESVTYSQLKQIKQKDYKTPGCDSVKKNGMCPTNCGAISPMRYTK